MMQLAAGTAVRRALLLGSAAMILIAASSQSAQAACTGTAGPDTCTIDSTTDQTIAGDGGADIDTFQLGGTVNFNFQVNRIGTTYTNWEIFQKVNTSNVTLINTAGVDVDWTILGGTLTASGGNSIFDTSDITVTGGSFALSANETIGSLTGNAGTTVNLGAFFLTTGGNGATTTYAGNVSGSGGITKTGGGSFTLSGTNTYGGATTISAGAITASGGSAIGDQSAVDIAAGASLNLTASETIGSLNGAAGSFVNLNANTLTTGGNNGSTTFAGVISGGGGLTKEGTGNLILTGQNTYSGTTVINNGTLTVNLAAGDVGETGAIIDTGAVQIGANGTLALLESETIGSLAGVAGAQVHLGSNTLIFGDATDTEFAGVISSIDSIVMIDLDPDLAIDDPVGPGETLVPTAVTVKGGIVKTGSGTVTLSGANTYTGSTVVDEGKLILAGGAAINDMGAVSLGSGTTLQLNASETIGSLTGVGDSPAGPPPVLPPDICITLPSYPGCPGSPVAPGPTPGTVAAVVDLQSFNLTTGGAVSEAGPAGPSCATTPPYACDYTAFAGKIIGSGSLIKEGSGTFILSGTNLYTGTTYVNDGTLALAGGAAIVDTGSVVLNGDGALALQASERIGNLNGAAGTFVNLGIFTLTTGDATNTSFGGVISGSGGLIKEGSGTFTLTGANTYTGTTTINAGVLEVNGGAAIADTSKVDIKSTGTLKLLQTEAIGALTGVAGALVDLNGQGLTINATSGTNAYAGVIQGSGSLTKTGAGTEVLSGANTFTGQTFVNGGTLAVQGGSALSDAHRVNVAGGATFELLASETIGSLAGVAGSFMKLNTFTLTTGGDNSSSTFAGAITGSGGLTKTGTGTFQLSGLNSYSGTTLISGGILQVAGGSAIGDSSIVDVGALGTLELLANETIGRLTGSGGVSLNANTLTINVVSPSSSTFSGAISGSGGVMKIGTGTQVFSGTNTYGGVTNVNGGVLAVTGGSAISNVGAVVVASGAEFEVQTAETIGSLAGLAGSSVELLADLTTGGNNGTTTFAGTMFGAGGLIKQGSGVFTLSGNNTFGGATKVEAGTLQLQNGNALADTNAVTLAFAGATLDLLSSERIGNLTGVVGSVVTLNGNTLTTGDGTNTTFSGSMSGTGGLTKVGGGTFLLDGTNTYGGQTTISQGVLQVSGGSAIADTSNVAVAAGATLDLLSSETIGALLGAGNVTMGANSLTINATTGSSTFSGVISGSGGVTKTGGGTQVLSGANIYGGTTDIQGGILAVTGGSAIIDTGAVMVASGATFQVQANETIGSLEGLAGSFAVLDAVLTTGGDNSSTAFAGNISGAGGLTKQGTGTFALSGTNTYSGVTTVNDGTLQLAGGNAIGNSGAVVVNAPATLDLQASETIGSLAGSGLVSLNANFLTTGNAMNTSFSGAFSGSGGMTKQGSGKFTTGNLAYTGLTTVNAGELNVNGSIAGSVLINAGGILSGNTTIAGSLTNFGTLSSGNSPGPTIVGLDYTGGGVMNVEVQLDNAGAPVNGVTHDYLQVGRDVLGAPTSINIVPFAPSTSPAATTGNGYELVRVEGNVAANAFSLSGPVIHGGYEYLLHYIPNYAGTTDGFFLQSAPLQQVALNAAMLTVGRTSKGLCEREDTAHPGLEGKRYRVSGDVRVGNYSAGADTGLEFDADHYCFSAGADAAVNQMFFLGMSGAWGETDAAITLPQGTTNFTGSGGRYQVHGGLTLGDFYAVLAAGFAKTEWEGQMVGGGGQLSADIKGGVGHLDAGYRLAFDRRTALTLSGRVDYDGTSCGDNCLVNGTVESISEWSGRAGLRVDTSWWNGSFRPFVAVGVSDDFGDGTSVTMLGATSSSNAMSMVLDADVGFNAELDSGADIFVRGRMISGLDNEIDGYEAAGGIRLMW